MVNNHGVANGVKMIRPAGGLPPTGLSVAMELAARRVFLVFLFTIN
jgi:hypothetical protein